MSTESVFLEFSAKKLEQMLSRIEECVSRLTPQQVWTRGSEQQNAIGNLLLHLNGNVRQWILHGVGGQPDARQRQTEFDARESESPEEMVRRLRATVTEASAVIGALPHERLAGRMTIQGHDVTALEAIYHVVEHFCGHTFQIIFMTKLLTGTDLGFYAYLSQPATGAAQIP